MNFSHLANAASSDGDIWSKIVSARDGFSARNPECAVTGDHFSLPFPSNIIFSNASFSKVATFLEEAHAGASTAAKKEELVTLAKSSHSIAHTGGMFLNFNAFISTIEMLGTPEQAAYWSNLVYTFQVLGAYAQTEIAHGSDVQGLLCRATYEPATKQFLISTPSNEAVKFWPGVLGINGTHCVLQAQTYSLGKHLGVQTFVLPIRDKANKMAFFPGVTAGDIGPKLGFRDVDNGFLQLTNYRVERDALLMKYCQLSEDGQFQLSTKAAVKLGYGSMLNLRVWLVTRFSHFGLSSACFAFAHRNPGKERQRELTASEGGSLRDIYLKEDLAKHFTFLIASMRLRQLFGEYKEQTIIAKNQLTKGVTILLDEVHALSAGMKACSSWALLATTRQNMLYNDPIGILNHSAQPYYYTEAVAATTYEGDNYVLLQQTGKFILKLIKEGDRSVAGQSFSRFNGSFAFLKQLINQSHEERRQALRELKLNNKSSVMRVLELSLVFAVQSLQHAAKDKESFAGKLTAWSRYLIEVMNCRLAEEALNNLANQEREKQPIKKDNFQLLDEKTRDNVDALLHLNVLTLFENHKQLLLAAQLVNNSTLLTFPETKDQLYQRIDAKFITESLHAVLTKPSETARDRDQERVPATNALREYGQVLEHAIQTALVKVKAQQMPSL